MTRGTKVEQALASVVIRRLRSQTAVHASVLLATGILVGLGTGSVGYLDAAATAGVRSSFSALVGDEAVLELTLPLKADAGAQDRQVRAAIERALTAGNRTVPVAIETRFTAEVDAAGLASPDPSLTERAGGRSTVVMSIPGLSSDAQLVSGEWPSATSEVTVQADAAAALALTTGEAILLGDARFTVTGTWRAAQPLAPRWRGDRVFMAGGDSERVGPVVVDDRAWADIGVVPTARWLVIPIVSALVPADVETLSRFAGDVRGSLEGAAASDLGPVSVRGQLAVASGRILEIVSALRAVQPLGLLTLAAVALVTLIELSRILTLARLPEYRLLRARGASAVRLGVTGALEVAAIALAGAVAGAFAANGILTYAAEAGAIPRVGALTWELPLTVAVCSALIFGVSAFVAAARSWTAPGSGSSARSRPVVGGSAVLLLCASAAIATWQLLLYGSPLTPDVRGGNAIDPVAVAAPTLLLLACSAAACAAFFLAIRLGERFARAARPPGRGLAFATVFRAPQKTTAAIMLAALACGLLVTASGYSGTWSQGFSDVRDSRTGAPIRIVEPAGLSPAALKHAATAPGVTAIASVDAGQAQFGPTAAALIALTPRSLAEVANHVSGAADPDLIDASVPGPVVPTGAHELRILISSVGIAAPDRLTAQIADAFGATHSVELSPSHLVSDASGSVAYSGALPTALSELRVLAVDLRFPDGMPGRAEGDETPTIELATIEALGNAGSHRLNPGVHWAMRHFGNSLSTPLSGGRRFAVDGAPTLIRMLPTLRGEQGDSMIAPVVLSESFAARFGVRRGDVLAVQTDRFPEPLSFVVSAIAPSIPGAGRDSAMMIDRTVLTAAQLRSADGVVLPASQLWATAADPAAAATWLRDRLPASTQVSAVALDAAGPMLSSAATTVWIAAVGAIVLALVGLGAMVGADLRARKRESAVLGAMGFRPREVGASRRFEFACVLAYGVIAGCAAGLAATAVTVPPFARAAIPDRYPGIPTAAILDLPMTAGAVLLAGSALTGVVLVTGFVATRQARIMLREVMSQ